MPPVGTHQPEEASVPKRDVFDEAADKEIEARADRFQQMYRDAKDIGPQLAFGLMEVANELTRLRAEIAKASDKSGFGAAR